MPTVDSVTRKNSSPVSRLRTHAPVSEVALRSPIASRIAVRRYAGTAYGCFIANMIMPRESCGMISSGARWPSRV